MVLFGDRERGVPVLPCLFPPFMLTAVGEVAGSAAGGVERGVGVVLPAGLLQRLPQTAPGLVLLLCGARGGVPGGVMLAGFGVCGG